MNDNISLVALCTRSNIYLLEVNIILVIFASCEVLRHLLEHT